MHQPKHTVGTKHSCTMLHTLTTDSVKCATYFAMQLNAAFASPKEAPMVMFTPEKYWSEWKDVKSSQQRVSEGLRSSFAVWLCGVLHQLSSPDL